MTLGCVPSLMSRAAWECLRSWNRQGSPTLAATAGCQTGTVYWPKYVPWLAEWEAELLTFPNGRHDDQADCFAYAALEATHHPGRDSSALAEAIDDPALTRVCERRI